MKVELERSAAKYYRAANEPLKSRLLKALKGLENEPPDGDIKPLQGMKGRFRLRTGDYRCIFSVTPDKIVVHEIAPRGQVYKGAKS